MYLSVGAIIALGGGGKTATAILRARTTERVEAADTPEPAALDFLIENPRILLTGIGWGNTSFLLRAYFDPHYYRPLTVTVNSGYLQILLEGGLPALLAFLFFLGGLLLRAGRLAARERDNERRSMLTITLAVCVVVVAIHAFTMAETQIWIYLGLLVNLWPMGRRGDSMPIDIPKAALGRMLSRRTAQEPACSDSGA